MVSKNGNLNLLLVSIMILKINPYPKNKNPLADDSKERDSTKAKFQGESEKHRMGGNEEI